MHAAPDFRPAFARRLANATPKHAHFDDDEAFQMQLSQRRCRRLACAAAGQRSEHAIGSPSSADASYFADEKFSCHRHDDDAFFAEMPRFLKIRYNIRRRR